MRCDFKIMGVESRMANIEVTKMALNLDDSDVFIDKKMRMNPRLSSLDVLRMPAGIGVSHRVILQDDIILSSHFVEFANKLVKIVPDAIFSLYSFTGYKPYRNEAKILKTGGKIWGPAVIIPLKYLKDIICLADVVKAEYTHDDGFYSYFAKKNGIDVLTTCPNVVQLADSKSFFNHRFVKTRTFTEDPFKYEWIYDRQDCLCCTSNIKDIEILR